MSVFTLLFLILIIGMIMVVAGIIGKEAIINFIDHSYLDCFMEMAFVIIMAVAVGYLANYISENYPVSKNPHNNIYCLIIDDKPDFTHCIAREIIEGQR